MKEQKNRRPRTADEGLQSFRYTPPHDVSPTSPDDGKSNTHKNIVSDDASLAYTPVSVRRPVKKDRQEEEESSTKEAIRSSAGESILQYTLVPKEQEAMREKRVPHKISSISESSNTAAARIKDYNKETIALVASMSHASPEDAARVLKECNWNVEKAMEHLEEGDLKPAAARDEDLKKTARADESLRYAPVSFDADAHDDDTNKLKGNPPDETSFMSVDNNDNNAAATRTFAVRAPLPIPPGAVAVGGPDSRVMTDSSVFTLTPASENPMEPLTAVVVQDTGPELDNLQDQVRMQGEELERMRRERENIAVGQVLQDDEEAQQPVANSTEHDSGKSGGTGESSTTPAPDKQSTFNFCGIRRKRVVLAVVVLLIVGVVVGGVLGFVFATRDSPESTTPAVSSPQSPSESTGGPTTSPAAPTEDPETITSPSATLSPAASPTPTIAFKNSTQSPSESTGPTTPSPTTTPGAPTEEPETTTSQPTTISPAAPSSPPPSTTVSEPQPPSESPGPTAPTEAASPPAQTPTVPPPTASVSVTDPPSTTPPTTPTFVSEPQTTAPPFQSPTRPPTPQPTPPVFVSVPPTTRAPVSAPPTTRPPTTPAPVSVPPTARPPSTPGQDIQPPSTEAPPTPQKTDPPTQPPTPQPTLPVTPSPTTPAPVTASPTTRPPTTPAPVTEPPTTPAPVTVPPTTPPPTTVDSIARQIWADAEAGTFPWYADDPCIDHPTFHNGDEAAYTGMAVAATKVFKDARLTQTIHDEGFFVNDEANLPMSNCGSLAGFSSFWLEGEFYATLIPEDVRMELREARLAAGF